MASSFQRTRETEPQLRQKIRQQDLRSLTTHLKGPEKDDLQQISPMQKFFNLNS